MKLIKILCLFGLLNFGNRSHLPHENMQKAQQSKTFPESLNTAVFTTKFVVTDHHDITLVRREAEDGALMFFSADKYENYESVAKLVGLGQLIKIDNTILQLSDLKRGYYAHRKSKKEAWVIEKIKP